MKACSTPMAARCICDARGQAHQSGRHWRIQLGGKKWRTVSPSKHGAKPAENRHSRARHFVRTPHRTPQTLFVGGDKAQKNPARTRGVTWGRPPIGLIGGVEDSSPFLTNAWSLKAWSWVLFRPTVSQGTAQKAEVLLTTQKRTQPLCSRHLLSSADAVPIAKSAAMALIIQCTSQGSASDWACPRHPRK